MTCPECNRQFPGNTCVCGYVLRVIPKKVSAPVTDPGLMAPDDFFVRRAVLRWLNGKGDIRDLMLEEFIADGGGPDHPDYLRLEEFMQRNAE